MGPTVILCTAVTHAASLALTSLALTSSRMAGLASTPSAGEGVRWADRDEPNTSYRVDYHSHRYELDAFYPFQYARL